MTERNLAFRNLGDLRFENVSAAWGLDQKGVSFGAAFGDLDGDGDLDLVYVNYQNNVSVLRNDSDTGHRVIFDLRGRRVEPLRRRRACVRIETASGVQVRQLVLARGYMSTSEPDGAFRARRRHAHQRRDGGLAERRMRRCLTNLPADRRYTITEPSGRPPPFPPPVHAAARCSSPRSAQTSGLLVQSHEEPVDEVSVQRAAADAPQPARARRSRSGTSTATARTTSWSAGRRVDAARILLGLGRASSPPADTAAVASGRAGRRRPGARCSMPTATEATTCW